MRNRFFYLSITLVFVLFGSLIVQISMQNVKSVVKPYAEIPRGGDVAVIGGSTAALITALVASENGAQVHLFPQGQELGNDTIYLMNEGLATWGTPPQQAWVNAQEIEGLEYDEEETGGMNITRESFQRMLLARGEGMNDPLLLKRFLDKAPELHRWIQDFGIDFDDMPQPGYNPFWLQTSTPQAGFIFREKLLEKLAQHSVFVQEETVKAIEMAENNGSVKALTLQNDEQGETSLFYVQAVVLADGGYSSDLKSWYDYLPHHNIVNLRPGQTGRGIQMAADLFADVVQSDFFNRRMVLSDAQAHQYQLLPRDPWEHAFLINRSGQSLDLGLAKAGEAFSFIVNAPNKGIYVGVSEDEARVMPLFFTRFDQWSQAIEAGWLDQAPALQAPPPYYLARVQAGVDYTLGGLSVTSEGEVRRRGMIINGLFAAGEIAGGLHGEAMAEGMPLSETLFLGRSAGEAAAAYARR